MPGRRNPTTDGYDRIARSFDAARRIKHWELKYFDAMAGALRPGDRALDCGCGSGHVGLERLIRKGVDVTALDGSSEMLALFRGRYPETRTVLCDMLEFRPRGAFHAVIAWDSFFHLTHDEQKKMIGGFADWIRPRGHLLFTSGPDHSSIGGEMFGVPFTYASFSDGEYRALLNASGFAVERAEFDEPGGRIHKVWVARKE